MSPEEYLDEEFRSVRAALDETLRYDYGDLARSYYEECDGRLNRIGKQIGGTSPSQIWARLNELSSLAVWISLIERSRLGEFSWPFAQLITEIATPLLSETLLRGRIEPIIHVVAEGEGYQIVYEEIPPPSAEHRFAVVAFPRPLKHHVLLHTIFGHELGHVAQHTSGTGPILLSNVRDALSSKGPLANQSGMTAWLNDPAAPSELKNELASYYSLNGAAYVFQDDARENWLEELICDLFGLLLFGPGFAAAHQVLLRPTHRTPYEIDLAGSTHPPYALRHRMIVQALRLLGWHEPATASADPEVGQAEEAALRYILNDPYTSWATLIDDAQLASAIAGVQGVLNQFGSFAYSPPNPQILVSLVTRLRRRLPPVLAELDNRGEPLLTKVNMAHALYAGWIYWLGRSVISGTEALTFLQTNRLCDQALLQERAIGIEVP